MKRVLLLILLAPLSSLLTLSAQRYLSLAECRTLALETDETLRQAENSLTQADYDKDIAFSNYLPRLDATGLGYYQTGETETDLMSLKFKGAYMAGLTLQQPLYAGGAIVASNRLAKVGQDAAGEQLRKTRMDVIANVDNAYWTLVAVRSQVQMLHAYQAYVDEAYRSIEVSIRAEMATQNDLLRLDAKKSEVAYQLQKAQTGLELCRLSLLSAIGLDFDTQIIPTDTIFSNTFDAFPHHSTLDRNPDLQLLRYNIDAAHWQVKLTRADYLPTLGLSLGYSIGRLAMDADVPMLREMGLDMPSSQNYDFNGFNVMATLSVPILNWGEGKKKIRKSKLDLSNAQLDLQQKERQLTIRLRQAEANVRDTHAQIATAQLGAEQATENLRVMQTKFDAHLATLTDLLDAQTQWQQAQSNLIEAQTQFQIYLTEYRQVTGTLE